MENTFNRTHETTDRIYRGADFKILDQLDQNLSSLVPKHHNCCNAVTTLTDKVITDEHTKLEIILIHGEVYIVHGPIYIVDRPKVPQQNSEDF